MTTSRKSLKPYQRASQEKPKERHRAERGVQNMQQDSNASDKEMDVVRAKTFNFHSFRPVLITKFRS